MKDLLKTYHNVDEWSVHDVRRWLIEKDFDNDICELFVSHKIDGKALLTLREDDLRKHPLQLKCLGEIKKLYLSISHLQTINITFYSQIPSNTYSDLNNINYIQMKEQLKLELQNLTQNNINSINQLINRKKLPINNDDRETSVSSVLEEQSEIDDEMFRDDFNQKLILLPSERKHHPEFKPEIWKSVVAFLYFTFSTWITAIVMVIVHDRVPDMTKYPPLPDIFLDNVPLIPFAFVMCELCGLILFIISMFLLVFHKHRFILIRRMFSLFGSVFLLRCFTMLITSLSVPGRHLSCNPRPYGDWYDKVKQAFVIWQGGGMSIQGVRTCGDYMFSGHTVTLTLLNFFITEYTPQSLYFVHTCSWVLNLFGIFFILAGHEHYSIDVFIAFYISTRLFLYYHTLANNRSLIYPGDRRTRIWFPLFYFFESGVNGQGRIPNEFELPFEKRFKSWLHKLRNLDDLSSPTHKSKVNGRASNQNLNNSNSTLDQYKSSSKDSNKLSPKLNGKSNNSCNTTITNSSTNTTGNDFSNSTKSLLRSSKRKSKKK